MLFGRERAMEISEGSVVLFGREYRGVGRLVGGLSLFGRERAVEVLSVDSRFRRRAIYGGSMDSCSSAEITWLSVDSAYSVEWLCSVELCSVELQSDIDISCARLRRGSV